MNILGKTLVILVVLAAVMLASCGRGQSAPAMSDAEIMETAISTVSTAFAETQRTIPTNTPLPTFSLLTKIPTTHTLPPTTPTVVPGPTGTAIFPPIESFVGFWLNTDSNSEGWSRILISSKGEALVANFRYTCELPEWRITPKDCDGGIASATYSGNPVLMFMQGESATTNYTLSLNGDTLHATTFTDYAGTDVADETLEDDFHKLVPSFPESDQIVFYHFVNRAYHFVPAGSVRDPLLFPAASDGPPASDTAADLRTALELVLQHEANPWISNDLEIVDVTFCNGHADIVLQGEYFGESDEVLHAASMQILLTVFANPTVESAAVTLNGDTIGNLGVSSSTNARPADYVYTRAELETYLIEHAFMEP